MDFKTFKDISTFDYVLQYHNVDWGFYLPRSVKDTQAVRFRPPSECSLVAFLVMQYNCWYICWTSNGYYIFVAEQRTDIDYDIFPGFFEATYFVSPLGSKFSSYENINRLHYVMDGML